MLLIRISVIKGSNLNDDWRVETVLEAIEKTHSVEIDWVGWVDRLQIVGSLKKCLARHGGIIGTEFAVTYYELIIQVHFE